GEMGLAQGSGPGGGRVLDALDRHAGHADLLDGANAGHRRHEEMPDVHGIDVLHTDAGVVEGCQAGVAAHDGVMGIGIEPEPDHPDSEDCDLLHLRQLSAGRNRMMTTSFPCSPRSASSSPTRRMPTRKSSFLPARGTSSRGASGRSTWPTP